MNDGSALHGSRGEPALPRLFVTSARWWISVRVVRVRAPAGLAWAFSLPRYRVFEEFFRGKAIEHLIGPDIEPEHLNDDRMGRILDKLFEAGLTELFVSIATKAAERFGVCTNSVHLDATSSHSGGRSSRASRRAGAP